jgi:hypothetical protein
MRMSEDPEYIRIETYLSQSGTSRDALSAEDRRIQELKYIAGLRLMENRFRQYQLGTITEAQIAQLGGGSPASYSSPMFGNGGEAGTKHDPSPRTLSTSTRGLTCAPKGSLSNDLGLTCASQNALADKLTEASSPPCYAAPPEDCCSVASMAYTSVFSPSSIVVATGDSGPGDVGKGAQARTCHAS